MLLSRRFTDESPQPEDLLLPGIQRGSIGLPVGGRAYSRLIARYADGLSIAWHRAGKQLPHQEPYDIILIPGARMAAVDRETANIIDCHRGGL